MQIQISWLLQKPTDLDLHCLQRQGKCISRFSRTRVKCNIIMILWRSKKCSYSVTVQNLMQCIFCSKGCTMYLFTCQYFNIQNLPGASELSSIHREVWKPSDLKRMEKLVLDKLGWKLYPSSSCLSFVEIMLNILQQIDIGIDEKFCSEVVDRLELFLNYSNCCIYKVMFKVWLPGEKFSRFPQKIA